MDKQLLEQVQKALQAQQDTIDRQNQMLEDKDRDIAELTASLRKLAQTQSEATVSMPALYERLTDTIAEQGKQQASWRKQVETYNKSMMEIGKQSITLSNTLIQLTTSIKKLSQELQLPEDLLNDTIKLEGKLKDLQQTQSEIDSSQQKIIDSQQTIQQELKALSKSTNS